jgi:hypothetical protein
LQRQGLSIKRRQLYSVGIMSGLQSGGRRLAVKLRVDPLLIVCRRYKSNNQLLQDSQKEYITKNVSPSISNFLLNQVCSFYSLQKKSVLLYVFYWRS